MANHIRHFAVQADDVERARRFYEEVFGWAFEPWGPPDFYLIRTGPEGDRGLQGALQRRRSPRGGDAPGGFECTIGVEHLDATLRSISEHGGTVVSTPFAIEGVGRLAFFHDTEENRVGVMQYDRNYTS